MPFYVILCDVLYNEYHWCPFKYTHTHSFQCFTESKITRCFFWQALDQDLHITLTQSFKEPICKHECHGVTIFGIVTWEKKGPSTERRLWSRIWCKAGHCHVQIVLPFFLHLYRLLMSKKNENSDLSAFQQNDNVNETPFFFCGESFCWGLCVVLSPGCSRHTSESKSVESCRVEPASQRTLWLSSS